MLPILEWELPGGSKFIVVFFAVCAKLVALNIGGRYETEIGTLQWHHVHSPKALPSPTIAHYNGTLQWHPAMAPRPLPQSPPFPHHSTLQWHPVMAPSNSTTSTPPKLVVTLHLNHSTLQWHPTMAPSNGTTSIPAPRPPPKLVLTLPPNHSTLQWHPAMAPNNGTTSIPPKLKLAPPTIAHWNGTQQWHHVHSPKVGRHPPPQP